MHSIPCGMPISGHETKTKDLKTARTASRKQHLEGMPQKCAQTRPMTCGRQRRSPAGTRYACPSQRTVTIPSFGVAVGSALGACPCIGGAGITCAPRGSLTKPVDESRDMARRGSQAGPKVSPAFAPTSPAVGSDLCSGRPDQSLAGLLQRWRCCHLGRRQLRCWETRRWRCVETVNSMSVTNYEELGCVEAVLLVLLYVVFKVGELRLCCAH